MNAPHPPEVEEQAEFVLATSTCWHPDVLDSARRVIERNYEYRWLAPLIEMGGYHHDDIGDWPTAAEVMEQAG